MTPKLTSPKHTRSSASAVPPVFKLIPDFFTTKEPNHKEADIPRPASQCHPLQQHVQEDTRSKPELSGISPPLVESLLFFYIFIWPSRIGWTNIYQNSELFLFFSYIFNWPSRIGLTNIYQNNELSLLFYYIFIGLRG